MEIAVFSSRDLCDHKNGKIDKKKTMENEITEPETIYGDSQVALKAVESPKIYSDAFLRGRTALENLHITLLGI